MTQTRKLLTGTLLACMLGVFGQGCADTTTDEDSDDSLAQAAASLDGAVVAPARDGGGADAGDAGDAGSGDAGGAIGPSVDAGLAR